MIEFLWMMAGLAGMLVLYLLWLAGGWLYERLVFSPEERWRRRYDRKLKKHFKSM